MCLSQAGSRMLLDAARALKLDLNASWMVGDTDADIAAGRAGCRTVLVDVLTPRKRLGEAHPDLAAATLAHGVGAVRRGVEPDQGFGSIRLERGQVHVWSVYAQRPPARVRRERAGRQGSRG